MNLPGMLYGKVLRSPHAHARIKSINIEKAVNHPNCKAIVTSKDLAKSPVTTKEPLYGQVRITNVLASDKVLYKGHPIAAIAATNPHLAEELLELIEVKYTSLKEVMDVETSLKIDSPVLHDHWEQIDKDYSTNLAEVQHNIMGDLEKGFQLSDCIVEISINIVLLYKQIPSKLKSISGLGCNSTYIEALLFTQPLVSVPVTV